MSKKSLNKQSLRSKDLKTTNPIMEKLLASQNKIVNLYRNLEIESIILSKTEKEIILDLGSKAEGVLPARELSDEQKGKLKPGDKLKVYVVFPENEHGQAVVSLHMTQSKPSGRFGKGRQVTWTKFTQAQNQKSRLSGKVVEINKGGLIVESEGIRGFLPNSQVGFEMLKKSSAGMDGLLDQTLTVTVIEVDQGNNKLIFSQRGQTSDEVLEKLKSFKNGQKVSGKIITVLPFGLVVDVSGMEGLVFISDVSWEKVEDLSKIFKAGDTIDVLVTGLDEDLGRLNLSMKQLIEDPFAKLSEKYPADEVVKGEITQVSEAGVAVALDGVEGFLPSSKMADGVSYEAGKKMSFLVDSLDAQKRRVNLASFVTSTEGLIYK